MSVHDSLTLQNAEAITVPYEVGTLAVDGWDVTFGTAMSGLHGRGRNPPRPLLAVTNVTAYPSTASVPITVFRYNGPLLSGFNVLLYWLNLFQDVGLSNIRFFLLVVELKFAHDSDSVFCVVIFLLYLHFIFLAILFVLIVRLFVILVLFFFVYFNFFVYLVCCSKSIGMV